MFILLLTTLTWAAFDVYRKMLGKIFSIPSILFYTFFSQTIIFSFLPSSFNWPLNYLSLLLSSALVQVLGSYCFILALKSNRFSDVIPLLGISPVFTILIDLFFGIAPSSNLLLGMFLVSIGMTLLVRKKSLPMIYAGGFWGVGVALDHQALKLVPLAAHGFLVSLLILIAISLIFYREIISTISLKFSKEILILFSLGSIAYLAELYCLQTFTAGYFTVFNKGVCFLISMIIGAIVFQERVYQRQVFSAVSICLGTFVIAS